MHNTEEQDYEIDLTQPAPLPLPTKQDLVRRVVVAKFGGNAEGVRFRGRRVYSSKWEYAGLLDDLLAEAEAFG